MMEKCPLCKTRTNKNASCKVCGYPLKGTAEEKQSFKQERGKGIIRMSQKVKYKADENMIAMFAMAVISLLASLQSDDPMEWAFGIFLTLVYILFAFFTHRNPILIPVIAVLINVAAWLLVYMPGLEVGYFALAKIGCFIYCIINGIKVRLMKKRIAYS